MSNLQLTDLCFLPLAAGAGTGTDPLFTLDEDGWWDVVDGCGRNGGDGATKD